VLESLHRARTHQRLDFETTVTLDKEVDVMDFINVTVRIHLLGLVFLKMQYSVLVCSLNRVVIVGKADG